MTRRNTARQLHIPILIVLICIFTASPSRGGGGHDHDDYRNDGPAKQEQAGSPLVEEMLILDDVFRDVISGVAIGDGKEVHAALQKMHGTMEKTHEGVEHGTVKLEKNADRIKDFVQQDKQFHAKLEDLDRAARKNDGVAMLSITKQLLDGCVQCHRDFRVP